MPSDLFARLPRIWARLDKQGVLERYLSVWDIELERIEGLVYSLFDTRNPDKINDFYLRLFADLVGHNWSTNRTRDWNRGSIETAITRHSYKGTFARFHDTVIRNGGSFWEHTDMASQIIVPGSQGYLGGQSSYLMGATLYHPGAHQFFIDEEVRNADFEAEVEIIRPAAEVWYLYYVGNITPVLETEYTEATPEVLASQITYSFGTNGYLGKFYLGSTFFEPFSGECHMESELVE